MNIFKLNASKLTEYIERCFAADLVPYIHSSPGMGKSSIIKAIAKRNKLKLIDIRLSQADPSDMCGFPVFIDGKASYLPFDMWPTADKPIPDGYNGWLIFFDEFPSAPKSVQAAAYRPLLDREIGMNPLHQNVWIAAAGNLVSDRAIVNPISTASQSRMIHFELEAEYDNWLREVALPQKYDSRVIAFLSQYPEKLMAFDPSHQDKTFPCPRTWEFLNRLLMVSPNTVGRDTALYAGSVGTAAANDFTTFCEVYEDLVKIGDILANPLGCPIPQKVSAQWAIVTRIAEHAKPDNIEKLLQYSSRMSMQFRVLVFRMLMARGPEWRTNDHVINASIDVAEYLWGDN